MFTSFNKPIRIRLVYLTSSEIKIGNHSFSLLTSHTFGNLSLQAFNERIDLFIALKEHLDYIFVEKNGLTWYQNNFIGNLRRISKLCFHKYLWKINYVYVYIHFDFIVGKM